MLSAKEARVLSLVFSGNQKTTTSLKSIERQIKSASEDGKTCIDYVFGSFFHWGRRTEKELRFIKQSLVNVGYFISPASDHYLDVAWKIQWA